MSETPILSEQDIADLESLGVQPDAPSQRTLLSLWREVLGNIEEVASQPIPAPVASKVVASWPFLTFQETADYHRTYHHILSELRRLLQEEIDEHPEAIGPVGEEDGEENHDRYRDLLAKWHLLLDSYEEDWRAETPDSHIWIAAIADARAFVFSRMGLAGHLDTIGFALEDDEFLRAVATEREAKGE